MEKILPDVWQKRVGAKMVATQPQPLAAAHRG
jgi:hypothetical protein